MVPVFEGADGNGRAHRVIGTWGGTLMGVGLAFTAGCVFALIGPDRRRIDPPSRFQ